jgi:large subunit ribosomal protein L21
MYAIVELGGRQWKVQPGSRLDVNRLSTEVGAPHAVEQVLLAHDGQQVQVGRPYVDGAKVVCEVLEHHLGPKTIAYYFRRRENWRKTIGHRQPMTRLVVKEILLGGIALTAPAVEAPAPAKATKPRVTKTGVKRSEPKPSASAKPAKAAAPKTIKRATPPKGRKE